MSTDIVRSFIDDLDQLPDEIPGSAILEPGRLSWLHGSGAAGAKTPGVFYGKDTAFLDAPDLPWAPDDRFEDQGERGYSAPELRIAVLGWRDQWFVPGQDRQSLPTWLTRYQDGAKKLTEYLIVVDGLADPMVLAVSGKYKAGPFAKIVSEYRRGVLSQAMRKIKRTLPLWSFWLPVACQRDRDGKVIYIKAVDADGKEYGSIVTPPALLGAPIPRSAAEVVAGSDLWQQYAEWLRYQRMPPGVVEGYVVEPKQLPPPAKNVPQPLQPHEYGPLDDGETMPF